MSPSPSITSRFLFSNTPSFYHPPFSFTIQMFLHTILAVAALAATSINASPIQELNARNLDPAQCSKVVAIVEVLKIQKATPFCSSFLSIKPATATSTVQVTGTV